MLALLRMKSSGILRGPQIMVPKNHPKIYNTTIISTLVMITTNLYTYIICSVYSPLWCEQLLPPNKKRHTYVTWLENVSWDKNVWLLSRLFCSTLLSISNAVQGGQPIYCNNYNDVWFGFGIVIWTLDCLGVVGEPAAKRSEGVSNAVFFCVYIVPWSVRNLIVAINEFLSCNIRNAVCLHFATGPLSSSSNSSCEAFAFKKH